MQKNHPENIPQFLTNLIKILQVCNLPLRIINIHIYCNGISKIMVSLLKIPIN